MQKTKLGLLGFALALGIGSLPNICSAGGIYTPLTFNAPTNVSANSNVTVDYSYKIFIPYFGGGTGGASFHDYLYFATTDFAYPTTSHWDYKLCEEGHHVIGFGTTYINRSCNFNVPTGEFCASLNGCNSTRNFKYVVRDDSTGHVVLTSEKSVTYHKPWNIFGITEY